MFCSLVKCWHISCESSTRRRSKVPGHLVRLYGKGRGGHHSWLHTISVKWEYLLSAVLYQWHTWFQLINWLRSCFENEVFGAYSVLHLCLLIIVFVVSFLRIWSWHPDSSWSGRSWCTVCEWVQVQLKGGSQGQVTAACVVWSSSLWPGQLSTPYGLVWRWGALGTSGPWAAPHRRTVPASLHLWASVEEALPSMCGDLLCEICPFQAETVCCTLEIFWKLLSGSLEITITNRLHNPKNSVYTKV